MRGACGTPGGLKGFPLHTGSPTMSDRELIEPNKGDKRYVRRDENGRFGETADVGKSLAADQRQHSSTPAKKGQGDRGDRQD